jgi:chromosome segregation ATPase
MAEDKALLARLDLAIDKLSDVSADIKAVLAVHESKFENQEALNNTYYDQIEKLHIRIGELRDENHQQHRDMIAMIEPKIERIEARLTSMEKWRWIIVGAAMLAGFIISSTNLVDLLK